MTNHPNRSFYFVRHGQTDWNVEGRMLGHTDIPLNQTGLEQAQQAADLLKKVEFDLIVSSPLSRAYETAKIIAERKGIQVISEDLLKERNFGKFEGKTAVEIEEALGLKNNNKGSSVWVVPDCAEQWVDTKSRSLLVIKDYLNRYEKEHILFVSHGAVFRAIHEALIDKPLSAENAKPYYFELQDDKSWIMIDQFDSLTRSDLKKRKTSSPNPYS